jgi:transposase
MSKVRSWVGLDVHAQRTQASVLDAETGELSRRRLPGPPAEALAYLEGLPGPVRAVYEAGPTGYGLARLGAAAGIDLRVCAPGLIPRKPADRVKTDARDADRLARLLAAGELGFVSVPTLEQEQLRDLVRAREDLRQDLMRARHRLAKLLLRRGLRYPGPGGNWTVRHLAWLGRLTFEDAPTRAVYADYLAALQALMQRRSALERALQIEAAEGPLAAPIARLRCFRGIDVLSAAGLVAEIGDFGRFARPTQVGDYLGLVPSERSSGEGRRQGAITRAGPAGARRLVVEASWHYRHQPHVGRMLERRQRGIDPRVVAVAWRAQRRLHQRFGRLVGERGKPPGQAAVACARELCCFLWEASMID